MNKFSLIHSCHVKCTVILTWRHLINMLTLTSCKCILKLVFVIIDADSIIILCSKYQAILYLAYHYLFFIWNKLEQFSCEDLHWNLPWLIICKKTSKQQKFIWCQQHWKNFDVIFFQHENVFNTLLNSIADYHKQSLIYLTLFQEPLKARGFQFLLFQLKHCFSMSHIGLW